MKKLVLNPLIKPLLTNLLLIAAVSFNIQSLHAANPDEHLRIGLPGEPETLDPHRYNLRLEETLLNDLFLGLTTFDAKGQIVPGAARSWTTTNDGLTWTFHLRKDLFWSDGTPLNADDFVYAFRRLQNPQTAASLAYFMHMVKGAAAINAGKLSVDSLGVSATDNHTLEIILEKPYPYLLERLLYPTAYPVPRHVIEQHGDRWTKAEHWVSNGAYTLSSWIPRAHIDLKSNPTFHDKPSITKLRYLPLSSELAAYNRYRSDEVHVVGGFPVGNLKALVDAGAPDLRLSDLLSMMYLVFNIEHPVLNDVRVRQALSIAIDQSILTDKVMNSGNRPAYSFAPTLISAYRPFLLPHRKEPLDARQARARSLLKEAGYENGLQLTLRHVTGLENKKVNLAISGMWRAIGVKTSLQQADLRGHFADLRQGDFEVAWAGWVGENNAEHYLSLLQSDIGNVNYGRFRNNTFDDVMAQAQIEKDAALRNELLRTAEEIATHFYPVVPLYSNAVRRLVHPNLQGWYENGRDMHQSRYLHWAKD
ncbi:MAG: peptide ABC transporter substrate-binding protein [Pseudomonadota bacterium]|nr:peptide ABC transporter substrate-binding protein [Pseudomonadota bacterium]